jgi:hypothetical protein
MRLKNKLLIMLALIIFPAVVFADQTISTTATYAVFTATVTPIGGVQTWTASLKNISDNGAASQLLWTGAIAGVPGYKVANQYIEIGSNITTLINWRMIVYTNNTSYTGIKSSNTTQGFGLVGTSNTASGLPLAWMVLNVTSATPVTPVFSLNRTDHTQGFTNYMWKFMQDKNLRNATNTANVFLASETYVRVWDNTGFYWNEDPAKATPASNNKIYMYIGTDFTHALIQSYSTNSLTLEVLQL